jgi:hypothetical protein
MKKFWINETVDGYAQYPEFKSEIHSIIDEGRRLLIHDCRWLDDYYTIDAREDVRKIIFNRVVFPLGLKFHSDQSVKQVVFNNCKFFDDSFFLLKDSCSLKFNNCYFPVSVEINCRSADQIIIGKTFFKGLEIKSQNCNQVIIVHCVFGDLQLGALMVSGSAQIGRFKFYGFIFNKFWINKDLVIKEEFSLSFVNLVDYLNPDKPVVNINGELLIHGGKFLGGLFVGQRDYLIKTDGQNQKVKSKLNKLSLSFQDSEARFINFNSLNINTLLITGANNTVSVYLRSCSVNRLEFDSYEQKEQGLINFRNLEGDKGGFKVSNTLIINDQLYFQNSDLQQWKSVVRGSLFKFHALLSKMPENFDSEINVDEKLETINTWLLNSNKESDIINWSELKKKQWKVLWEKRKNNDGLTFGQKIQKATQWTNDYGTKWQRAFWLYLGFNFMTSVLVTFHNVDLIHCYLNPCQSAKILCDEFQVVFANFLYPLSKPKDIDLIFVFVKVINAVLLVQLVAAFRGYFRGR